MRALRWGMGVLAAVMMFGASSIANDTTSLKAELADLKAKVASMESAQAGCNTGCGVQGDCESLTSMKKKGVITIGGDVEIDINVVNRDDAMVDEDDEVDSTSFRTADADLNLKVAASQDVYLFLKLDLDDAWNGTNQDDLLEECYFMWKNIRCSNWSIAFGKKEVAYGQDKDVAITDSYHHNSGTGSWLGAADEEYEDVNNAHSRVSAAGNFAHPGEKDNVFQIAAIYNWCDWATMEATLFQNVRGMNEDRSDDHLGFQSGAIRLTVKPVEGLTVSFSAMNEHFDSTAEQDQQSISLAFDYKVQCMPLEIFGEYQHGFDYNYTDDYDVDIAQLGLIWGATECIDVVLAAEWMNVDDDSANTDEDYIKAVVAGKYTFDNGIYMMLEYAHEWYDLDAASDVDADADVISFRTAWSF